MPTQNIPKYGPSSIAINNKIKNGQAGILNNNRAVRNFAHGEYIARGHAPASVQRHMDNKDAGHRVAQHKGGKNTASNYMWEDRTDNRAHGDARIRASQERIAGRR